MSSFNERYIQNPMGRTVLISFLIAAIFAYIGILIPLADVNTDAWYSFLYGDSTVPASERLNWGLVIIEALIFSLFYLFFVIGLGGYAEMQSRLPSWGEIIFGVLITLIMTYLIPQITVTDGTGGSSGYHHFTPQMRTWVFWLTVVFMVIWTLYLYYTESEE